MDSIKNFIKEGNILDQISTNRVYYVQWFEKHIYQNIIKSKTPRKAKTNDLLNKIIGFKKYELGFIQSKLVLGCKKIMEEK